MIKTLLANVTGNVGTWLLGIAVAAIATYIWMQSVEIKALTKSLETANENVVKLKAAVDTQSLTIAALGTQHAQTIASTQKLNSDMVQLREEQNEIEAQYNEYRGRLAKASAKKPGLVERLANNAFSDVLQSFSDATARSANKTDQQSDPNTGTSGKAN